MGRRPRNPYRFFPLRAFLLSFLLAFMILTAFGAPILLRASAEDEPIVSEYEPDWSDRIRLLCALRDDQGTYRRFFLLGLDPFANRLYVAPLPRELMAAAGDRQNSLRGFASYGGTLLCAEALAQSYGLTADRVLTMTELQLRDLINVVGGVRFELRKDCRCLDPDTGAERGYSQGSRRLDGRAFCDLMLNLQTDTHLESLLFGGQLLAGLFNDRLTPRQTDGENGLEALIGYMTTDLGYADYLSRADALDELALTGRAELVAVGGSYSYGGARFTLSEAARSELSQRFG